MTVMQAVVVEQAKLRPNASIQRIALFGPTGEPLVFSEPEKDDSSSKELSTLKGRVTKLENRIKEWEGGD